MCSAVTPLHDRCPLFKPVHHNIDSNDYIDFARWYTHFDKMSELVWDIKNGEVESVKKEIESKVLTIYI